MIRSVIRIALAVVLAWPVIAADTVRVEFTTAAGASLDNRYGDYCPTKILWADRVYDRQHVLDPTQMPFTRLEWPDGHITDPNRIDPAMLDGRPAQAVIIAALLKAGVRPLVCIRVPPAFKNDLRKVEDFYFNVTKRVGDLVGSRGADIELFNEPDLLTLDHAGSKEAGDRIDRQNQDRFIARYAAAYRGADRARTAHLRIGGPGFALSGFGDNQWMGRFLDEVADRRQRLDFVSYHIYLDWSDRERISDIDRERSIRRSERVAEQVAAFARRTGRPQPPIWITEFAWTIGNAKEAFARSRTTMFNHQHCARTLESFLIGRDLAGVTRCYWAQGPGQYLPEINLTGDDATFFPLINYHRERRNGRLDESWRYKAGVPAFHFINTLPGTRRRVSAPGEVGAIASSDGRSHELALWSRGGTQQVRLSFPGLGSDLSRYRCDLRVIDGTSWKNPMVSPNVPARSMTLDRLGEITLGNEVTAFLTITGEITDEEEGLSAVYFNRMDLTAEGHRRIDRAIDFRWSRARPAAGIDAETFSVRWTGSLIAPSDGDYVLNTESDDGVRVWLDDRLVIDQWNHHQEREDRSPKLRLTKGRHRIRVEFFDRYLTAVCVLSWQGPGFAMRTIQPSSLRSR